MMALGVVPAGAATPTVAAPSAQGAATQQGDEGFSGYTDKTELKQRGRSVVAAKELRVTDGSAPAGGGTTYYVDSQGGDDAAQGTSASSAWKSFKNVNVHEFQPGDRILLKAGSSWTAEGDKAAPEAYDYTAWDGATPSDVEGTAPTAMLAPKGSGTASSPIVISSYGTGAAPQLDGRGVVNDVVQLSNQEHWDISQLDISNVSDGFDATTFQPGSGTGQVPGTENPLTGDVRGIHIQAENAGTLSGYSIHDTFVHDVSGVLWSVTSSGVDRSKRTGGILFEGLKGDAKTASQFEDISVKDNVIANTSFANVVFKQYSGMGTYRYHDVAPGWGDRTVGKASPTGEVTEDPDWRPHRDVTVEGNYFTNRDTQYGWDSMYLTSVQNATVQNNEIDGAGVSGIEMYYSDDVVVQNNEVGNLEPRSGAADSNAIDPDRDTTNALIQGNYIHDSGEGILLCGFGFGSSIVRYNVIADVDRNYVNPHGDSGVNVLYNNLMYNTVKPLKNNTVGFFESSGTATSILKESNRHVLMNNVFLNARDDVSGATFHGEGAGVVEDSNAYFGTNVTAPTQDAHAVTGDPQLGGNPADDIKNILPTAASSSLIAAGARVDLGSIAPGFRVTGASGTDQLPLTTDFFGTPVTDTPNVGPASYAPAAGKGLVVGTVRDADGAPVAGATVTAGEQHLSTDAHGRYAFEAAAGDYTLTPTDADYADGRAVAVTLASGRVLSQDLVLGATTATTGTVRGTVTSGGAGLSGVTVTVTSGSTSVASTTSGADGGYTLADVPAGTAYTVTFAKDGYTAVSQKDVTVKAAGTLTLDTVLSLAVTAPVYALNESFDHEATGAFTGTADGVLAAKTDGVGSISIVDDPDRAGNKYLKIDKNSGSAGTLQVFNTKALGLKGIVTIVARLARTSTNGTPNQAAMYSYAEKDFNATNPSASTNPAATFGFAGGKIMTHNVTGSSGTVSPVAYTAGRWYEVRNVVNLDKGTFSLYVDDMGKPVLADQPLRTLDTTLDRFNFFINGTNQGDLLVDSFRINTGTPYERNDAGLGSVAVKNGEDSVKVTASSDGASYTAEVPALTDSVTVAATPHSDFASVSVNGEAVGKDGVAVPLAQGSDDDSVITTTVPVLVTAEDGSTKEYSLLIHRDNPNLVPQLRGLSVEGHVLTPGFDPAVKGEENPYSIEEALPADARQLTLNFQRGWAGQSVQINGAEQPAGASSATLDLKDGRNVFDVSVSSFAGDFATYRVVVDRTPAEPTQEPTLTPSASVKKLKGNTNELTVTVVATDEHGKESTVSDTFTIENNAADTYTVGPYKVYVDTKGNTQIRDIHLVD